MAAQLIRLRWTLLVNGFRRSTWQTIGFVIGTLYVLGIVGAVVVGTAAGGLADPAVTHDVVVLGGGLLVLGWWVLPLLVFGMDATLDPQRFTTFGTSARRLLPGLALASLVGIGGMALVLLSLGSSLSWLRDPLVLPVALLGGAAGAASAVLGARALTTALAPILERRRVREVLGVVGALLAAGAWLTFVRTTTGGGVTVALDDLSGALGSAAGVVAWTPFGAPWALAGDVHDGAWLALVVRLAVTAATLALAWWGWRTALDRALVTPPHASGGGEQKGLGWFGRLPATPTAAVAARAATYWVRDPRYGVSIVMMLLIPIVLFVVSSVNENHVLVLFSAPFLAWLLGFSLSDDVAYDSTAFALHVATGTSGRADRLGRCLPVLAFGVPLLLVVGVVTLVAGGRPELIPVVLGGSLATLGVSLGVASVTSTLYLYPVPKPGDGPFKQPQGAALASMVGQGITSVASAIVCLPLLALVIPAIVTGSALLGWITLVVGVAYGAAALVVGVGRGAAVYERRLPELFAQVVSYR